MNDAPRATVEKLFPNGNGLRVEFYWLGDRFGHTISAVKDGVATIEWRSIDDDPLGPVYQELHEQETDDGGKIVFLSGAGNGAHWSASVIEIDAKKFNIAFDVAARVTREPSKRVIEYRGVYEDIPTSSWSTLGDWQADWDAPLMRFALPAADTSLPSTLRTKYSIMP